MRQSQRTMSASAGDHSAESDGSGDGAPQPTLRSEEFLGHAMDRFGGSVYLVALSQMRSEQDAQDVAQDVFVKLLTASTDFTSDEHLKAWLLRVTINRCHEVYRGFWRGRVSTVGDERELDRQTFAGAQGKVATDDPAEAVIHRIEGNPLWQALRKLPADQRAVLVLFYIEECSTEEIARIVGLKPPTVRTKLHRARQRVRRMLEREGYENGYQYE